MLPQSSRISNLYGAMLAESSLHYAWVFREVPGAVEAAFAEHPSKLEVFFSIWVEDPKFPPPQKKSVRVTLIVCLEVQKVKNVHFHLGIAVGKTAKNKGLKSLFEEVRVFKSENPNLNPILWAPQSTGFHGI